MTFRAGKEGHTYFMMDEKEILDNIKRTCEYECQGLFTPVQLQKCFCTATINTLSALTQPFTGKY